VSTEQQPSSAGQQFRYALVVLTVIPSLLIANTVWLLLVTKSNLDAELRRKANVAVESFASTAQVLSAEPGTMATHDAILSRVASTLAGSEKDITAIQLLRPEAGSYVVAASESGSEQGARVDNVLLRAAWDQKTTVAALVDQSESGSRSWRVVVPLLDSSGHPWALASLVTSGAATDRAQTQTIWTSILVLVVILAIMVALLINHLRFAAYADLFRRQQELDQLKDDFISIATHELKSPMSVIKGYISMVLDGYSGRVDAEGRKTLQVAYDHTERLNRLVSDLLNVSRLEQGRTIYNATQVSLADIITPLVEDYRPRAKAKGLVVHYKPDSGLPPVLADVDRVGEIMANLLDNAVKYSLKGTVEVAHVVEGGMVVTTVKDTGIGMTPAEQARLFGRFYRAQNAETRDIPGTGLGLWIIRQYAQQMGGGITVASIKGQGTIFSVTLPIGSAKV
jgi:signal transduction histidine kinase